MGNKKHRLLTDGSTIRTAIGKRRTGRGKGLVGDADRTFIDATVTLNADQVGVRGVACDVSENGMKIELDSPLELGPVSVKLVGLPAVSGEICWSMARHVGVRLIRPLAPDVLADWIKYHGSRR